LQLDKTLLQDHYLHKDNLKNAIFLINLNKFKEIHDTLGYEVGERVLQKSGCREDYYPYSTHLERDLQQRRSSHWNNAQHLSPDDTQNSNELIQSPMYQAQKISTLHFKFFDKDSIQ